MTQTIDLYIATYLHKDRGVWAAMLSTEHQEKVYRRKFYGTLRRTTQAHLEIHAMQEALHRIRKPSQVTIHAQKPDYVLKGHELEFGPEQYLSSDLKGLLPENSKLPRTAAQNEFYVPCFVSGLSTAQFKTAISRQELTGQISLAQLTTTSIKPLIRLSAFDESIQTLTPNGLVIPRCEYRELNLQLRDLQRQQRDTFYHAATRISA